MLIYVELPPFPTVSVEVNTDDVVRAVKVRAATALRVDPQLMQLVVEGVPCEDEDAEMRSTLQGDTVALRQVRLQVKIERLDRAASEARFELRKKPRWFEKILDDNISAKWHKELLLAFESKNEHIENPTPFDTESAALSLLAELSSEAALIRSCEPKATPPPFFLRAQDDLMPEGMATRLDTALTPFRTVPDWHPGSNNQVMDLVDPSLYCYAPESVPADEFGYPAFLRSQLQWLPAEFKVSGDAEARQLSYINNVDPAKHGPEVEAVVTDALGCFLPLLRTCRDPTNTTEIVIEDEPELDDLEQKEVDEVSASMMAELVDGGWWHGEYPLYDFYERHELVGKVDVVTKGMAAPSCSVFEDTLFALLKEYKFDNKDGSVQEVATELGYGILTDTTIEGDGDELLRKVAAFVIACSKHEDATAHRARVCTLVNKAFEKQPATWMRREVYDLKTQAVKRKAEEMAMRRREVEGTFPLEVGSNLQVIVKAADIVLTPDNPVYPGGTWHPEGMHENIVATCIYYYKQENVTSSHLEFREEVDDAELDYPDGEHQHIFLRYRVENGDEKNKWRGEVSTPEGRCIVFPNDLQHRAAPFQLVDDTKPGVWKMLVFFVVDPAKPTTSSASVPRQQDVITLEKAKGNRERLMEARRSYIVARNEECTEEISLCGRQY